MNLNKSLKAVAFIFLYLWNPCD